MDENKMIPILELNGITKEFPGVKALDNVQLRLYPGKVTTLMGENGAGKSTIMKIIFGMYKQTSGTVKFNDKEVHFATPKQALENGIAMVHQELNQVMTTRVMDNVWLGRFPKSGPFFVDHIKMYDETQKIFDELEIDINPKADISKLSVSQRQMIEIARAVSYNSKVLILDEPTSSLTENEVEKLFKIVRKLKQQDVAILFVSHKMDEIRKISDFITVFRDGKYISEYKISEVTDQEIIRDMVGRDMNNMFPQKTVEPNDDSDVLLEVKLKSKHQSKMGEINFKAKRGEILGIAGLVGSKRTEIVEMIFGLMEKTHDSKVLLEGKECKNNSPSNSMKNGFALVTEERKKDGIFEMHDITFNSTAAQFGFYTNPFGILKKELMVADAKHMINTMSTKTPSTKTQIGNLSGGNQQKVVISKWLLTEPKVLLLDEPTRGIDVGAKYQIYELIQKLAEEGKVIIIISSELPELLGVCHNILVMSNGIQAGILKAKEADQEKIMTLAAKHY